MIPVRITFFQAIKAKLIQIFPGSISLRHVIFRQFGNTEFNLHITTVRNLLCILKRLQCIWKQLPHLFLRLNIILTALIPHTVFIFQFLSSLDTQQNIMWLYIFGIGIMYIIRRNKLNSRLLSHTKERLIHDLLFLHPMILQFQEKISFSKNVLIPKCRCLSFFIHPTQDILLYLTGQTCTERNDPFMKFLQYFNIYPRFIIITFRKSSGYDLHQIVISDIIFCQKYQMVVTVITASDSLFIESGSRCNIDLAPENRFDSCCFCRTVKINHAIHHTMIRNRHTVHPKFFYPGYTFFNFI